MLPVCDRNGSGFSRSHLRESLHKWSHRHRSTSELAAPLGVNVIVPDFFGRLSRFRGWTNLAESFNVWWMNVRAAWRANHKQTTASRDWHAHPPSREELQRQLERQQREIEKLREQVAEREQQIAEQQKQIADLERQLALRKQNSMNSSKPPSSDGLAGEPRERGRQKKSRRKVGGQPGHRGAHRPLAPAERVDEIRPVLPERCRHCGRSLPPQIEQVQTIGAVQRHQVTELPPIQARIIEYQCPRVLCPGCGESTRATVPEEATGHFGPQLTALIAYLTVVCRMPRRVVEALLEQVLGIEISLGSTQKCWEEASQAVAAPCRELEQQLKDEPVLNVDETGWRTNGDKRFLWAFVAARYLVYTVAATRGSEVLIRLLGAVFRGILCSDRFSAYLKYHSGKATRPARGKRRHVAAVQDVQSPDLRLRPEKRQATLIWRASTLAHKGLDWNRSGSNGVSGKDVFPPRISSHKRCPVRQTNGRPFPLKPAPTKTFSQPGSRPISGL
jgi:transposase